MSHHSSDSNADGLRLLEEPIDLEIDEQREEKVEEREASQAKANGSGNECESSPLTPFGTKLMLEYFKTQGGSKSNNESNQMSEAAAATGAAVSVSVGNKGSRNGNGSKGVVRTDCKNFFTSNKDFPAKDDRSHICSICVKPISIIVKGDGRYQWQNGKHHLQSSHPEDFKRLIGKKLSDHEKEVLESANRAAKAEREKLIENATSLAVSKTPVTVVTLINAKEPGFIPPLLQSPKFDWTEMMRARLAMAYWVARDGLSQNTFEKEGYRAFAATLGLEQLVPCPKTIRSYQSQLARICVERIKEKTTALSSYGPWSLVSIQTDVWSAHDGTQQMGVRITGVNPIDLKMINHMLPLEPSVGGSLNAEAEAELVRTALLKVNLSPESIYSQTTNPASVALLSSGLNVITSIKCKAHQVTLALKAVVEIADSTNIDLDADQNGGATSMAARVFAGVSARAAHFHRSALAERQLGDFLTERGKDLLKFVQWSPTRWTGVYEATLRDTAILAAAHDFICDYVDSASHLSATARAKLKPINNAVRLGLQVLSVLKPMYDLTLLLQKDDVSLGEAFVASIHACLQLTDSDICMVDTTGAKTANQCQLTASLIEFRNNLCVNAISRLLDNPEDETLTSIALDPQLFEDLKSLDELCGQFDLNDTEASDVTLKARLGAAVSDAIRRTNAFEDTILVKMKTVLRLRQQLKAPPSGSSDSSDTHARYGAASSEVEDKSAPRKHVSSFENIKRQRLLMAEQKLNDGASFGGSDSIAITVATELASFKALQKIPQSMTMDGCDFWLEHGTKFPNLFHVFLANRGARPSSGRLESCGSLAGGLVPPNRESMTTQTLNNLLMLKTTDLTPYDFFRAAKAKAKS